MSEDTRSPFEQFFNLPAATGPVAEIVDPISVEEREEIMNTASSVLEKIESALPEVSGLESADGELDELAKLATDTFSELVDLGSQVEPRFASEIFNAASSMLGHAITAKTNKLNKKLKMIDLQLKQAALAQKKQSSEQETTETAKPMELDRNELMAKILNRKEVKK